MNSLYFPPEVGGLESHVHTLCRELARRGHEVTVLTSRSRPGLARAERVDGLNVYRAWMPSRTPAGWVAHALASVPLHLQHAAAADILHAQTFAMAPPAWPSRWRYGPPLVLSLHTSHFLVRARRRRWRPILRRIIASADALLAASREILDTALELHPHPRAEVLLNAVDTNVFRPGPERDSGASLWGGGAGVADSGRRDRLLVPRRLFPKNGVEYLVRALPRLARERDVQAVIVGEGPERPRLETLARELGIADRVRFAGSRPHCEMPPILRAADLVLVPSLMEASSVAALEAMACGVPVAASRVGGLPEIVDDEVGALFEPADPESLAATVARLLADEQGLRRRGEAARRRVVERFSLDRLVDRHLEIYRTLVEERDG